MHCFVLLLGIQCCFNHRKLLKRLAWEFLTDLCIALYRWYILSRFFIQYSMSFNPFFALSRPSPSPSLPVSFYFYRFFSAISLCPLQCLGFSFHVIHFPLSFCVVRLLLRSANPPSKSDTFDLLLNYSAHYSLNHFGMFHFHRTLSLNGNFFIEFSLSKWANFIYICVCIYLDTFTHIKTASSSPFKN